MFLRVAISTVILVSLFQAHTAYRVVCVYTNWAQYRPDGGKFLPEDIDAHLCTHIIYVYAKLKGSRLGAVEWNDEDSKWSEGMYSRVNNLKQSNPELKTLLGVGGWMMGSKGFSRMAAGRGSRRMFAQSSVKFLRDRGFDGLTIDWQHPTMRGGRPRDRENFSLLLKELRTAFDDDGKKSGLPTLLLTAGVSASKQVMEKAYEIDNITRYTDFLNVMAYDLHGSWDNYTGHPSQLYARKDELGPTSEINVDTLMKMWIAKTGDRSKLNLGISTYGRTFTLKHARHTGYQVPSKGPGNQGEFTQQPGMLAYYERCNQYYDASHVWDDSSKASYWVQGDQWIAGEDVQSVKAKITWAKYHKIGGAMLWSLDTDDFASTCGVNAYPITDLVKTEFGTKLRSQQVRMMKKREDALKALRATTIVFEESTTISFEESTTAESTVTTPTTTPTTQPPPTTTTTTVKPVTRAPQRRMRKRPNRRGNMKTNGRRPKQSVANSKQSLAKQRENDRALLTQSPQIAKQKSAKAAGPEIKSISKLADKPSQKASEIQQITKRPKTVIQSKTTKAVNVKSVKEKPAGPTSASVIKPISKPIKPNVTIPKPRPTQPGKKPMNGKKPNNQQKKNRRKRPKLTPRQREILRRRMMRRRIMMAKKKKDAKGREAQKQGTKPKP